MVRLIGPVAVTVIVAEPVTGCEQPATDVAVVKVYVVVTEGVTVTVLDPEPFNVVLTVEPPFQ